MKEYSEKYEAINRNRLKMFQRQIESDVATHALDGDDKQIHHAIYTQKKETQEKANFVVVY